METKIKEQALKVLKEKAYLLKGDLKYLKATINNTLIKVIRHNHYKNVEIEEIPKYFWQERKIKSDILLDYTEYFLHCDGIIVNLSEEEYKEILESRERLMKEIILKKLNNGN